MGHIWEEQWDEMGLIGDLFSLIGIIRAQNQEVAYSVQKK